MKSIFPISKEYAKEEELASKAKIEMNHQAVQPVQQTNEPHSKYTAYDLALINQARDVLIQITSRVGAQGGVGSSETVRAPNDLEIAKTLNSTVSLLDRLTELIQ
jgi:hypothetical protein